MRGMLKCTWPFLLAFQQEVQQDNKDSGHTIALLRSPTTICVSSYYTCILPLHMCLALQVQVCLEESERRKAGSARAWRSMYLYP